jgi:hypothetical protein
MLHVRRSDKANLSIIFSNLTLDLNQFSIDIQNYLIERVQDPEFNPGGIKIPFPRVVARADLEEEVVRYDLTVPLNYIKVRAKVTLDRDDKR